MLFQLSFEFLEDVCRSGIHGGGLVTAQHGRLEGYRLNKTKMRF